MFPNPFKSRTHILKKKGLQTHHDLPELLLLLLVTLAEQWEGAGGPPLPGTAWTLRQRRGSRWSHLVLFGLEGLPHCYWPQSSRSSQPSDMRTKHSESPSGATRGSS